MKKILLVISIIALVVGILKRKEMTECYFAIKDKINELKGV